MSALDEARAALTKIAEGPDTDGFLEEDRLLGYSLLAIAEELRTANLIAYVGALDVQFALADRDPESWDESTRDSAMDRHTLAGERIREALGL